MEIKLKFLFAEIGKFPSFTCQRDTSVFALAETKKEQKLTWKYFFFGKKLYCTWANYYD